MAEFSTFVRMLGKLQYGVRGFAFASSYLENTQPTAPTARTQNRLEQFFEARHVGRGIWKWEHYFEIYDCHFKKFVGRSPALVEIGVLGGGSLDLWRDYFGDCSIYGVDINPACLSYEDAQTRIFIGDQSDREFWKRFKSTVAEIDIVIDDGGHEPEQQIATLEELLPHLRPGAVYLCEDVHGEHNGFSSYAYGLVKRLNAMSGENPNGFQRAITSIHFYPYVTVIEKAAQPVKRFLAPRHGTDWSPRP